MTAKEGNGIQFGTFKNSLTDGSDICLVDAKYDTVNTDGTKAFSMNHWSGDNYGGWKACDLRYDILGSTKTAPQNYGKQRTSGDVGYDAPTNTATSPVPKTLMAALPTDLRAVMKPISKYTNNVGDITDVIGNISKSVDYLPLLAEQEIFGGGGGYGGRTMSSQYEKDYQVQYAYYSAGNSKIKYQHNSVGSAAFWWQRSPNCPGHGFCFVNTNGTAGSSDAGNSFGLAPAFMV